MRSLVGKSITHATPFEEALDKQVYKQSLREAMVEPSLALRAVVEEA